VTSYLLADSGNRLITDGSSGLLADPTVIFRDTGAVEATLGSIAANDAGREATLGQLAIDRGAPIDVLGTITTDLDSARRLKSDAGSLFATDAGDHLLLTTRPIAPIEIGRSVTRDAGDPLAVLGGIARDIRPPVEWRGTISNFGDSYRIVTDARSALVTDSGRSLVFGAGRPGMPQEVLASIETPSDSIRGRLEADSGSLFVTDAGDHVAYGRGRDTESMESLGSIFKDSRVRIDVAGDVSRLTAAPAEELASITTPPPRYLLTEDGLVFDTENAGLATDGADLFVTNAGAHIATTPPAEHFWMEGPISDTIPIEIAVDVRRQTTIRTENIGSIERDQLFPIEIAGIIVAGQSFPIEIVSAINRAQIAPLEIVAGVQGSTLLPLEIQGAISRIMSAAIEIAGQLVIGHPMPIEQLGSVSKIIMLPIEALGSIVRDSLAPIEFRGTIGRSTGFSIEVLAGIAADDAMRMENVGTLSRAQIINLENLGALIRDTAIPGEITIDVTRDTILPLLFHGFALIGKAQLLGSKVTIVLKGKVE